jgi:hypothetical protein
VYTRISVLVCDTDPSVTIKPAACHVVPDVSESREHHDVAAAHVRKVVGHGAPDHRATDDHDPRPRRKRAR